MSGVETAALLYGSAGTAATATTAATAATTGLIGTAGSFAWMPTLSTLGTALTAGSLVAGGMAQSSAADANAAAGQAAALAEEDAAARNAFAQERQNRIQAEALRDEQQRAKARRAVGWGTSGVTMAGSPLKVEEGAAFLDELALTQTLQTGKMEVSNIYYGAAQRADKLRRQASLDAYMGGTYRTGGVLSGAGTLLTAGAKRYA